jgi:hypothetical protein
MDGGVSWWEGLTCSKNIGQSIFQSRSQSSELYRCWRSCSEFAQQRKTFRRRWPYLLFYKATSPTW